MESQPQNPEFRNNPENFQPCSYTTVFPSLCGDKLSPVQVDNLTHHMWKLEIVFMKHCAPNH